MRAVLRLLPRPATSASMRPPSQHLVAALSWPASALLLSLATAAQKESQRQRLSCSLVMFHTTPPLAPFRRAAEERLRQYHIRNLDVVHVQGDPRSRADMKRMIDVSKFKAAVVVCGAWGGRGSCTLGSLGAL